MKDADKRLRRLVDKLHGAASGSAAFEGAERDARRVLDWLQAKSHELESELQKVAHGAGAAVKNIAPRKEHREPDQRGGPEAAEGGTTEEEAGDEPTPDVANRPETMGG